jgi:IclR family pca regulon transcriptional regulator
MGQVLLASLPPDQFENYAGHVKLVERTERTITSIAKLRKVIEHVREAGYAVLDQELEVGLRSIAVPVRDTRGKVVAAVNVSAHASRASLADMKVRFLPTLKKCAVGIGNLLAG